MTNTETAGAGAASDRPTQQPEALRSLYEITHNITDLNTVLIGKGALNALHAENTMLQQGYAAARLEIESLRARSPIPPNSGEYPALPEPDTRWRAQFAGHGVSFHSEDQIIGFANERASAAVDADRAMRAAQPAVAMLGEQAELRRLSDCCPELNLSNYGPDDVDELNGWAIEVSQCIDRALAAQPAGAQQPGAAYAALPDECDSPEICAISKTCAGQFGTKRICASHGQAPAGASQPAATVIKKGADRQWMSERLGHLPDGIYSLYIAPQPAPTAQQTPAQAAPAAQHATYGWQLVPIEVTDDMLAAFANCVSPEFGWNRATEAEHQEVRNSFGPAYRAMLAAAPQQEATDALARAEYYIDNPSAWSSFDQRISDDISAVTEALRAVMPAPQPSPASQGDAQIAPTDVLLRTAIAETLYQQVRIEHDNRIGPWSAFDVREQQRIVDSIQGLCSVFAPASQGDVLDAVAAEREACAQECLRQAGLTVPSYDTAVACAAAIRARAAQEGK